MAAFVGGRAMGRHYFHAAMLIKEGGCLEGVLLAGLLAETRTVGLSGSFPAPEVDLVVLLVRLTWLLYETLPEH